MPGSHQTISTPNPRERSLVVQVEDSIFVQYPDILPPEETLYKDCPKQLFDHNPAWNDYKYVEQVGDFGMLFVKTKTDRERNTPIKKKRITRRVDWDAVLEWIIFGKDSGFPLSQTTINNSGQQGIVTADRWLVPRGYRSTNNLMSVIDITEYLSDVMWPEYLMESDEPQPTEVMWDLTGSHGSMGKCLHDDVIVPSQSTSGYRVVTTSGNVQSANATGSRQWVFPKTNHKKRRDYEIIEVEHVNGQYLKRVHLLHVPNNRSRIIQQS